MANRERGEIGVDLDGRNYTLRPDFNGLCALEDLTDKPWHALFAEVAQGRFSGTRAVIFALLQQHHKDEIRTLDDAGDWIDRVGGADAAQELIFKVFELNGEEGKPAGDARPPKAQATRRARGTGASSKKARTGSA